MARTDMGRPAPVPSRAGAAAPIVPQGRARLALIVISVAALVETLRFALPVFGRVATDSGADVAAAAVLLSGAAGLCAPLVRSLAGPRALLTMGIGGLLAMRLVVQAVPPRPWLACLAAALVAIAVVALYEAARGLSGVGFATAGMAGLALDTALRLGFGTWDPVWRPGPGPWAACLVLVGVGLVMLAIELRSGPVPAPGISWHDALGAAAFGPFLAIQVLVLSSPAFAASAGWLSPAVAGAVVLAGQALALAFLSSGLAVRAVPGGTAVLGGTVLGVATAAVTGPYGLSGRVVTWIVLIAGQLLATWLLAVASRAPLRRAGRGGPVWRIDLGAALGAFLTGALLLSYQLAGEVPLPFSSKILPGLAGIMLGLLAAIAAARGGPLPARSARRALGAGAAALTLLAVPLFSAVTAPAVAGPRATATPGRFQLVAYNIREAVGADGRLDPERVARAIEARHADVVLLQEVGRGRLASGTSDTAGWLARRLRMHLIWGPAADNQFGNAVLSRLPVRSSGAGRLPQAGGAQVPGYVWARVEVGGGRTVDVWSTRLADAAEPDLAAGEARAQEIQAARLLRAWGGGPRTVIAVSLRSPAADRALDRLSEGTGLRNASAAGVDGAEATGPEGEWIFGTDDVLFAEPGAFGTVTPDASGTSDVPGGRPVGAAVSLAG
ncbi:MAG TPA: endonuclease/exonuclease/phosphatase family protein [Streptosporangiaceae bacterium]|nr:endonuclease/exonuclease/phosphatase family protein [Streptosporangiaceae bacterium]